MTINIKITIQGAISHFFHFTFLMNPSLTHIANSVSFYNDKGCKMRMTINILSVNVGDTVTFNYSSGHNVEEVTQEAFDSCTVSSSHTIFVY